jgi:hypothetical protein
MNDGLVSKEIYRACMRQLLDTWENAAQYEVPADRYRSFLLTFAWAAQVHRFGRAFLKLEEIGLENECHPLLRAALEYAVVGHWVARTGDDAVIARYIDDQRQLKAMVNDAKGSLMT